MIDVKDDELDDVNEKDDDEECHKFLLLLPATPIRTKMIMSRMMMMMVR